MSNDWVEVCIQDNLDVGELLSRLNDAAVQGAWEDEGTVRLYWPEDQWNEELLASVRSVLSDLAQSSAEVPLSVIRVPAQDWNETWVRSVRPLRIDRLVIRQSWEPVTLEECDIEIILDPKQAFGTGHHATTRMMLEWLHQEIHGGEEVLDMGTGSAILSMAAVKLGAASAIGVEIDPVAAECARESVVHNALNDRIDIFCGTLADWLRQQRAVDLVLANLDRQTLLELAEQMASFAFRGARIMVSGILVEQQTEIMERFSGLGLVCSQRCEDEGWVAMKLLLPESCDAEV
jgi:ribosomal protein L11 methyltransferase